MARAVDDQATNLRSRFADLALLALLSSLGGCAILAGYDFGSYHGRGASGGGGSSSSANGGGGAGTGGASTASSTSTGGAGPGGGPAGGGGTGGGALDITIYSGDNVPTSLGLATDKIYFTTDDPGNSMGTVERRDKDGSNAATLATALDGPASLSIDSGFIYFSTFDATDTIGRVSTTTSGASWLVSDASPVGGVAATGSHLYWSRTDATEIRRANLDGTGSTAIVTTADSASLLTADADGVFWLSVGTLNGNDSQVMRADLDGANAHAIAMSQDFPVAIATDSTRVYWGTIHGGIVSRLKDESTAPILYQAPDASLQTVDGIAAFDGTVYATESSNLLSAPSTGGAPTPFRQGLDGPKYVAADADSVCYSTSSNMGHKNLVVRIPR